MLQTTSAAFYLWVFLWSNSFTDVTGQENVLRIQKISGALSLRCPESPNDICRDQCSNPRDGTCWPTIAEALRENSTTAICRDTVQHRNQKFTSEIIYCTLEGSRYECRMSLTDNEKVVYLAVKVQSDGGIGEWTMLNGDERRAHNSTSLLSNATLHHPGYPPLENLNDPFPFDVYVLCRRWMMHCNIRNVLLLAVKFRCHQ